MKPKLLLCNCKGLCPSFKDTDMNTLPFQLESDLDVEYAMLHPQLCGQGGNAVLLELLRAAAAEPDAPVVVGACAPDAQFKLFKKVMRQAGFPEGRLVQSTSAAPTTKGSWAAEGGRRDAARARRHADGGPVATARTSP